jgi:hypothetical protein
MRVAHRTVPIFVPTLCSEALCTIARPRTRACRNHLITRNNAQYLTTAVPTAKCLKIRVFVVRDQEAGGSNPLAPTIYPSRFQMHVADLRDLICPLRVGAGKTQSEVAVSLLQCAIADVFPAKARDLTFWIKCLLWNGS